MKKLILIVLITIALGCNKKDNPRYEFAEMLYGEWSTNKSEPEIFYLSFYKDGTYFWKVEYNKTEENNETGSWSCTETTITSTTPSKEPMTKNYFMPDINTLVIGEDELTYFRIFN